MDPVSLTGLVLSLTTFCGKAVSGLNTLKDTWDDSNLSLTSLAAECTTLVAALSVLEETLLKKTGSNSSNNANRALAENGSVTEALHSSIRCCFMTVSELNDEISQIQRHTVTPGTLKARGKVTYIINEGRINQLAGLLRGQSGVITTLQTVLQRQSLEEMERMMRQHNSQLRRANSESERSWRKRNRGALPPRSILEVESAVNAETITTTSTMFQKPFDFDDIAVNATVYRKVMSRAIRSRDNLLSHGDSTTNSENGGLLSLFTAVKTVDFKSVSSLLRHGDDPNQIDGSGMAPLQRCASILKPDAARIASALVHHGADIDAHRPGTGMTALRIASKCGNLSVVKTLIGMGADPSIMDRLGAQAIHAAVQFNQCEVVDYLIGGSTVSSKSTHGVNFDIQASMWDEQELARDSSCTLLHFAAASSDGDEEMVKLLLRYGLDPNCRSKRGKTALQYAATRQKASVALCFVKHGCDMAVEVRNDVREMALENDWPEVMICWLQTEQNTYSEIQELAERAVHRCRYGVADALLASLVTSTDSSKETLGLHLMFAVEGGLIELSKYLLERGASPWGLESYPSSPLSAACSFGYEALMKILLEYLMQDPRAKEVNQNVPFIVSYLGEQSPLTLILKRGHMHLVPLLPWGILNRYQYLENGLPPFVIVAATTGNLKAAEILIKLGVDPNGSTNWDPPMPWNGLYCDETALSFAARRGLVDWVRFLLANDAQVDCHIKTPSEDGRRRELDIIDTPLTAVLRSRQPNKLELVKILLSHGADVNFILELPSSTIGDVARRHRFQLISDSSGQTFCSSEIPDSLLTHPRSLDSHRRGAGTHVSHTPLMLACEDGSPALARTILADRRIDLSLTKNFGPLHVAVMSNNLVMVETLLSDGRFVIDDSNIEQPSMDNFWPVCLASLGGFLDILRLLVDQHSACISSPFGNTDSTCQTLRMAAHRGQTETVKFLLSKGAGLSWHDGTFLAARSNEHLTAILAEELMRRQAGTSEDASMSLTSTATALSAPFGAPPTPLTTPNKGRRIARRLSDLFRRETWSRDADKKAVETYQVLAVANQVSMPVLPEVRDMAAIQHLERQSTTMFDRLHGTA